MARTASTMLALGTLAPDFALPDIQGRVVRRTDFVGKCLLVAFICNHCPFVIHLRHALAAFGRTFVPRGLNMVAINSNDWEAYPADAPDKMAAEVQAAGYGFPYLHDATQEVAAAYHAACTPDFFLFGNDHRLVYRGQFDDSRPGNGRPVTGDDLARAAEATLLGLPVPGEQRPSLGCNIKWRTGHGPEGGAAGPGRL